MLAKRLKLSISGWENPLKIAEFVLENKLMWISTSTRHWTESRYETDRWLMYKVGHLDLYVFVEDDGSYQAYSYDWTMRDSNTTKVCGLTWVQALQELVNVWVAKGCPRGAYEHKDYV